MTKKIAFIKIQIKIELYNGIDSLFKTFFLLSWKRIRFFDYILYTKYRVAHQNCYTVCTDLCSVNVTISVDDPVYSTWCAQCTQFHVAAHQKHLFIVCSSFRFMLLIV